MSLPADLQMFKNLRLEKCENPLFGYLNINSLRNKIKPLQTVKKLKISKNSINLTQVLLKLKITYYPKDNNLFLQPHQKLKNY